MTKKTRETEMQSVYRNQIVEGVKFPGIIHNMNYYYTDFAIYSDGTFSCWEIVDLVRLQAKIDSGWIRLEVPVGKSISVHGLGRYAIESARWFHNKKSYLKKINRTLKKINPRLENLYKMGDLHKRTFDDRKVLQSSSPVDFVLRSEFFMDRAEGSSINILFERKGEFFLSAITIYENELAVLQFGEETFYQGNLDGLKTILETNGKTSLDFGSVLHLDDLGKVTIGMTHQSTSLSAKMSEIDEVFKKVTGKKTLLEECREVYFEYLQYPHDSLRTRLKVLYERIPEHQRIYLGDMDTRDTDYQRIIYEPKSKREV